MEGRERTRRKQRKKRVRDGWREGGRRANGKDSENREWQSEEPWEGTEGPTPCPVSERLCSEHLHQNGPRPTELRVHRSRGRHGAVRAAHSNADLLVAGACPQASKHLD